jgi:hypothetical protein
MLKDVFAKLPRAGKAVAIALPILGALGAGYAGERIRRAT